MSSYSLIRFRETLCFLARLPVLLGVVHADWLNSEGTTGACSCKCLLQIVHCLSSCGEKVLLDQMKVLKNEKKVWSGKSQV